MLPIDIIAQRVRIGRETAAGDVAEAILKALDEAGFALVPKEPTSSMGFKGAAGFFDSEFFDEQPSEAARAAYRAMLEAGRIRP